MTRSELVKEIYKKKSFLCVGLDTDITKIPKHLLDTEDPIFEFNKAIIDATQEFAIAFKPNTAFYEAHGIQGWQSLQKTMDYISKSIFTIADAKRGDIGNTSSMYAEAFFNKEKSGFDFDSVTVAPYMGSDSVIPFLKFPNKWVILLGLTSNEGSINFQQKELKNNNLLFEDVLKTSQSWGDENNMMYVIGATKATELQNIRKIIPNHFLLVPGVGAQGGSLKEVSENGLNKECGLLVNSSRGIIYAGNDIHFAEKAHEEAKKLAKEMSNFL